MTDGTTIATMNAEALARAGHWRRRIAAGTAAVVGVLLVLMGGGHLYAVISAALAEGRPLDYRLVSLIATGGIVAYPGLLSLSVCRWLWEGRGWAYAMCIASDAACLVYLVLLVLVKARDPGAVANVGAELESASILVGAHLVTLVSVGLFSTRSHDVTSGAGRDPNKRTIEVYMDGFRNNDRPRILACLTDDVEWVIPGAFHARGKSEFAEHIVDEGFVGRPTITVDRLMEENDVVVAEGSVRAPKQDGSFLDLVFCDVFEMRGGRIGRLISYLVERK